MLQYQGEANNQDCVSEILDICGGITVADYPIIDLTRRFNFALDLYFGWAFKADGQMKWDDFNETSPAIDTQDITATNRYKLSGFTMKIQNIIKLELLDSDGDNVKIEVDTMNLLKERQASFDEVYTNAGSGTPTKYIILGDFIYLDKVPNFTKTDGLLIYPDRPASYMLYTDTTKVPGVLPLHIREICELTSYYWMVDNGLMSRGEFEQFKTIIGTKVKDSFSDRTKNIKKGLSVIVESNK